jgi:O-antigen/teichoic acid export membrane protein
VLIAVAWIPLKSFNQLLPPIAADLHSRGEMDTLRSLYTAITRLVVTLLLPLLAIQLVFGRTILRAFGRTFVDGYVPLTIYLIAVLVGSSVGATGWLLIVTDHQYARMALDWLLAVLNGVLTVALILEFGLAGAALGTTIAMGVQNSLQVLLLRRFESLWPVDATFLRPAGAGLAMVGAMAAVRWAMRGPQAALPTAPTGPLVATAGSVIGVATYALVLRHLGIDPRDRLVVRELAARYRQALRDWVGLPRSG